MTTSQELLDTELSGPPWDAAMAEFRARAQRLFEAQRDRIRRFESSLAEQLAALDQAELRPPAAATNGSPTPNDASPDELEGLRAQLAQCRKLLNARASELKQLRGLVAGQADGAAGVDVEAMLEQVSEMRLERDELIGRLADAQRQVEQTSAADAAHFEELQRRFEMAVQEIRELKAKNSDLQRQASRGEAGSRDASATTSTGFDWEQQKLRLMQQLESDLDENLAADREARLSIESTIRITDQVIADKDRQIADLKSRLEEHAAGSNQAITSNLFDNDEQIRAERERLSLLEDEWRGKLRQAEIDISVERAKLARERSELETRLRNIEELNGNSVDGKPAAKQSGRWLSRLGLKEDDK